jgi:hypothetical protein
MVTVAAIEEAKSFEGPKVRDTIETISAFRYGGIYNFSQRFIRASRRTRSLSEPFLAERCR